MVSQEFYHLKINQLYNWSIIAYPQLYFPFLYYKGSSIVTIQKINQLIHKTAEFNHLDPKHFSSKSLRVAGTTTLATANLSSALIAKIGGWKSLTFLDYTKITLEICNLASNALTNPDLLTINHLHQICNSKVIEMPDIQKYIIRNTDSLKYLFGGVSTHRCYYHCFSCGVWW
jgi:hypothetical protein